jgi:Co/Zn/Cd efflux system component
MTTPTKEGLESALDFTKFVITLDGALIAFVTGATFLTDITSGWEKAAALGALAALLISIAAGILVSMEIASKLSNGSYDLGDKHVKIPGMVNVISFALGAAAVSGLAAFELILESSPKPVTVQKFQLHCAVDRLDGPLDCSGQLDRAPAE